MVLVGTVALLNLVLTFGVIRRLREHTGLLAERDRPEGPAVMLATGEAPDEFAATTTGGERLTRDDLGGALVGFFSPNCGPCREQAPLFVRRAAGTAGGRSRVLAVVVGDETAVAQMVAEFEPVARVVVERGVAAEGSVSQAFGVRGFPALAVLDADGAVAASGFELDRLPAHALVA